MRAIFYAERLAAIATPERVFLAPELQALPSGHPDLRLVCVMCLFSREVDRGRLPGPYTDARAELFGRLTLLPDEEFEAHAGEPDARLARRFGVPVEQVARKRREMR